MRNKLINKYSIVALAILIFASCKKESADLVDIDFTASKVNVAVGEEITFIMGYGADALSIYPGIVGKEFSKSAVANLGDNPTNTQYLLSHPYVDSFRVDAVATQPVPSTLIAKGTGVLSPTVDSCFAFSSTSTNGRDTLSILPNTGGFYPNGQNNIFNQTPNRTVTIQGYLRNVPITVASVAIRARLKIAGIWSNTLITQNITVPTNRDSIFTTDINLTNAINAWQTTNGLTNYGKVEEIALIFGLSNGTVPSYQGIFAIKTIRFGERGYLPWDTGLPVQYLNYQQPAIYKYTYTQPGTYIATMVATSVGRKKFAPSGYIETRLPSAAEYNLQRQVKQIQITVQ